MSLMTTGVRSSLYVSERRVETTPEDPASETYNEDLTPNFLGRLAEIRGGRATAALTLAFRLVREVQRRGEPVAWVARHGAVFYPPDVAEASVDLEGLVIVWVADATAAAKAADRLIRSGGFGLVVLDLGSDLRVPAHAQARLAGLAKKHHAAVVCLTEGEGERATLGSLISIRLEALRLRRDEDRFFCEARALKDKRRGPGWKHVEVCRGPHGLC